MKRRVHRLLLLVCGVGLVFGLVQLFRLRFEGGDVYPKYSSLRADPLGTMAFCESLARIPSLRVRRDFSPDDKLPPGRGTTYLHLAAPSEEWDFVEPALAREIDGFLADGGRLVITFFPENTPSFRWRTAATPLPATNAPAAKNSNVRPRAKAAPAKSRRKNMRREDDDFVSAKDRWGWELEYQRLVANEHGSYQPVSVENQTDLALPETLDWHSALVLTNLGAGWETIYARSGRAVLAERRFGAGSLVLATDSYFLSNEAMSKERHADLLAWLVGPNRNVVFDEAHFGLTENAGVATLLRKYHLYWLVGMLVLLAGLFVWRNSLSFLPPHPEEAPRGYVQGKDAASGFVNLLRRNVAVRDLLNVCFAEWTKSLGKGNSHLIARVDRAQAVIETENALPIVVQKPVKAYREICAILGREGGGKSR